MQNRITQRFFTNFNVIIYQRNTPILVGETGNICSKGIFIKTDGTDDIPEDDLEIGFEYGSNGSGRIYKLPATLIHRNKNGVGMEYKNITNDNNLFTHTLLGYISLTHKTPRSYIH